MVNMLITMVGFESGSGSRTHLFPSVLYYLWQSWHPKCMNPFSTTKKSAFQEYVRKSNFEIHLSNNGQRLLWDI